MLNCLLLLSYTLYGKCAHSVHLIFIYRYYYTPYGFLQEEKTITHFFKGIVLTSVEALSDMTSAITSKK